MMSLALVTSFVLRSYRTWADRWTWLLSVAKKRERERERREKRREYIITQG